MTAAVVSYPNRNGHLVLCMDCNVGRTSAEEQEQRGQVVRIPIAYCRVCLALVSSWLLLGNILSPSCSTLSPTSRCVSGLRDERARAVPHLARWLSRGFGLSVRRPHCVSSLVTSGSGLPRLPQSSLPNSHLAESPTARALYSGGSGVPQVSDSSRSSRLNLFL